MTTHEKRKIVLLLMIALIAFGAFSGFAPTEGTSETIQISTTLETSAVTASEDGMRSATVTATITPERFAEDGVEWSVAWENEEITEPVSDYVTLTAEGMTVTVNVLKEFEGKFIILTATALKNGQTASLTLVDRADFALPQGNDYSFNYRNGWGVEIYELKSDIDYTVDLFRDIEIGGTPTMGKGAAHGKVLCEIVTKDLEGNVKSTREEWVDLEGIAVSSESLFGSSLLGKYTAGGSNNPSYSISGGDMDAEIVLNGALVDLTLDMHFGKSLTESLEGMLIGIDNDALTIDTIASVIGIDEEYPPYISLDFGIRGLSNIGIFNFTVLSSEV